MNFLNNQSIKIKMILIFILPVLALTYQIIGTVIEKREKVNDSEILAISVELATKVSALVHEAQKERGATAVFLGAKGKKFSEILKKQRADTQVKLNDLTSFTKRIDLDDLPYTYIAEFNVALSNFSKVSDIRRRTDSLSISKKDAISFYTNSNANFLDSIATLASLTTNLQSIKKLNSYVNFLYSKEKAGVERAVGAAAFSSDKISPQDRIKFNNLIAEQNSFMKSYEILGSEEELDFYKSTMQGKDIDDVNKMRAIILNTKTIGGFNVDATYWFETMTKKIAILKSIEDYMSSRLVKKAKKSYKSFTDIKCTSS